MTVADWEKGDIPVRVMRARPIGGDAARKAHKA
jgi:hypothetical protein